VTLTNLGTAESVKIVYAANGTSVSGNLDAGGTLPMNRTGASVTLNNSSGLGGQNYNIVAAGPNGEQSVLRSFRVASS